MSPKIKNLHMWFFITLFSSRIHIMLGFTVFESWWASLILNITSFYFIRTVIWKNYWFLGYYNNHSYENHSYLSILYFFCILNFFTFIFSMSWCEKIVQKRKGTEFSAGTKVPTSKRNDWLTKERANKVSSQKNIWCESR